MLRAPSNWRRSAAPLLQSLLGSLFVASLTGCPGPAASPATAVSGKWYSRALASYEQADLDDAESSIQSALKELPGDKRASILGAKIALARLDYAGVERLTRDFPTDSEALGIRGRGFWYAGDTESTARTLEAELRDPEVKDPWAKQIVVLARDGRGRHPFALEGALLADIQMPTAGPLLVVPMLLDEQEVLAVVMTGSPELMVDTSVKSTPAWVSLRFNDLEMKDVPSLPMDLSELSSQLKAPIKAIIGVNLLRHLHATFDRRGSQFVVRREEPMPPPEATKVPIAYARGGAMTFRVGFTKSVDDTTPLLLDTGVRYPMTLSDETWKHAGVDLATLVRDSALADSERAGVIPNFRLGAFEIPRIPAVSGTDLSSFQSKMDMKIGGVAGSSLFVPFRVTLADEGRFVWLEQDFTLLAPQDDPPPPPPSTTPTLTPPSMLEGALKDAPKSAPTPATDPKVDAAKKTKGTP